MKLWLDDERPAPDETWTVAKTSAEGIAFLHTIIMNQEYSSYPPEFTEASLDHDLGGDDTGMLVLDYMVEHSVWPKELTIHTANPPARDRMIATANRYSPFGMDISLRYW